MSVRKDERSESAIEYLMKADTLYHEVIITLAKFTQPYRDLLGKDIAHTGMKLLSHCEAAHVFISENDKINKSTIQNELKLAKISLNTLDILMRHCYEILLSDFYNAYEDLKDEEPKKLARKAKKRLNKMGERIGLLISEESSLLDKAIEKYK